MDSRQEESFDWQTCSCLELGAQICSHYENWCSEQQSDEWWASLTDEERASYDLKLCNNCYHAFEATDDDGEQEVCENCKDWLDDYDTFGINF